MSPIVKLWEHVIESGALGQQSGVGSHDQHLANASGAGGGRVYQEQSATTGVIYDQADPVSASHVEKLYANARRLQKSAYEFA